MSKKLIKNKNNEEKSSTSPEKFSFVELNELLLKGNIESEPIQKLQKPKKNNKKETEKKEELKIKPNEKYAREHTPEDLMFIENEEELEKKELQKEIEKEKEKEIKKESIEEKPIPKKNIEKKKADKRTIKINIDFQKPKTEDQSNNKEEEESKNKDNERYNVETLINNIKNKDPNAYTPITLPFEKDNKKEEKSLKEEIIDGDENKLFIFQFPRQIPIKDLENQINAKEEENVYEEPNYDENGFLESPEFKSSFNEIKDNTVIGKLVIMKSGKIKIKMGDIYFDINQGNTAKFAQYSTIIVGNEEKQAYILGKPYNSKLIVTPEFD